MNMIEQLKEELDEAKERIQKLEDVIDNECAVLKDVQDYIKRVRKENIKIRKLLKCAPGSGSLIDDAVVIYEKIIGLQSKITALEKLRGLLRSKL